MSKVSTVETLYQKTPIFVCCLRMQESVRPKCCR